MTKTTVLAAVLGCALSTMIVTGSAQTQTPAASAPVIKTDATSAVARGEYLTHSASMCVQCHSGRDDRGNIIPSQEFHGGAIPFTSPWPNVVWAPQAPNIAGLPGFTDEQVISLLTEGQMMGRQKPRPPMPPFRMSRQDAEAVVAYLRTR